MRDALAWLALGIGYTIIAGVCGSFVAGALLVLWSWMPKPRVIRWRA